MYEKLQPKILVFVLVFSEKLPPLRTQDAPLPCLNRNIYTKAENSRFLYISTYLNYIPI